MILFYDMQQIGRGLNLVYKINIYLSTSLRRDKSVYYYRCIISEYNVLILFWLYNRKVKIKSNQVEVCIER